MVLYYKTFEILNVSEPTNKFLQLYDCTLNFYFFHYLSKIKDISDKKLTVKSKKRRHTSIMNSFKWNNFHSGSFPSLLYSLWARSCTFWSTWTFMLLVNQKRIPRININLLWLRANAFNLTKNCDLKLEFLVS